MDRGVTCRRCGASTPLPADLRAPTFACAFCHAVLRTVEYAGAAAVSADALLDHVNRAFTGDPQAASRGKAPVFQGGSSATRPGACKHCNGPVAVSLNLSVRDVTCGSCGKVSPVNAYIPDAERFALDMGRQAAGNDALKRIYAEGLPCPKCGGRNRIPDDGTIQVPCSFCGTAILLADHVDASAVARARLKHGVFAMRDEALRAANARSKATNIVIGAFVVLGIAISALVAFLTQHG